MKLNSFFLTIATAMLFASCNQQGSQSSQATDNEPVSAQKRSFGGTFRVNETENFQTLYPYSITDNISANIAFQVYEGLVKFDPLTLKVLPAVAEKWEISDDGIVYTFHLRKGVMFQDDPCFEGSKGREVKAADFKYSFELLCTESQDNFNFGTTFKDRVKGATAFYEASKNGKAADLEGVKVIDDYTLQITLVQPMLTFLDVLTTPGTFVVANEAVTQYGNMLKVGVGPFKYSNASTEKKIILVKNPGYYGKDSLGNKLPFLDSVIVSFVPTKKEEIDLFKSGKLDMVVGIPSESVSEFLANQINEFKKNPPTYYLDRSPDMASHFYELNLTNPVLKNVKVRQAMSYAIDRDKIVNEILKNQAYGPGTSGVIPPSFKGYDNSKIVGYDFNPERARKLLAEAGYPDGKGFPALTLELNSGGSKHTNVAFEIQKQLKDQLNININLEVVSLPQKLEDAKFARADIFRSGWVADYPNPVSFLQMFSGKNVPSSTSMPSFPNTTRYVNPEFDALLEKGRMAKTTEESYKYFMEAEQVVLRDAPVIVLWYDETFKLLSSRVQNYKINPMGYRSLAEVFIQAPKPTPAPKK